MSRILVVDDEPAIVDVLVYNLTQAGHQPITAGDGTQALELIRTESPDLVILDLMLPGVDGLDICREVRKHSDLPIIMLTARAEEIDRVLGLELGADDYVVKPFSVRELMSRVKAVLRRTKPTPATTHAQPVLRVGQLCLDVIHHQVSWQGRPFDLTAIQFDVLCALMAQPTRVFTREELLNQVWGYDYYGDARTVDSTIKRLRARLREVGAAQAQEWIVTVRDVGYKLTQ
jgi:DNA-binding response OmpR family regulator